MYFKMVRIIIIIIAILLFYCHQFGVLYSQIERIRIKRRSSCLLAMYLSLRFRCCCGRFSFVVLGERPEAMQTGTSTYFADKGYIMHTLLVATIISIYNIFRDYYSSIIIERMSIEDIT